MRSRTVFYHQSRVVLLLIFLLLLQFPARAQESLLEADHGIISTWYANAEDMSRTFQVNVLQDNIMILKEKALASE